MATSRKIILIAVTRRGVERARLLRARLQTGLLYRPGRYGPATSAWEHLYSGPLSAQTPALFAQAEQLVFFLAVGAVTRLIAPCLASKKEDPGVLAVDEAGRFVVPVLSGHQGGANAFARSVAGCLGATPVITTASDVLGGLSLDLLAERFGWKMQPSERLAAASRALVDGDPVAVIQEIGTPDSWLADRELPENVTCVHDVARLPPGAFAFVLWITDRQVADQHGLDAERIVWIRPRSLVLGVGCERGLSRPALADGLERFLRAQGFAAECLDTLASVDVKADEEAIAALAQENAWRTAYYPADELARVAGIANPSAVVARCVGTPGVAEPAALRAAEADRLLVEKQVLESPHSPRRMTFALARRSAFQERRQPGRVIFVGAGPGDPELLTVKARRALGRADVIVYAGSLIPEEVVQGAACSAELHNSASLTLEEVLDVMVRAAHAGKTVLRLQSGDTSIYSAIQEQMTRLDEAGIAYEVIPGISAFQAAAAALKTELTLPEAVQTVILTRGAGRTKMPAGEQLEALAQHGATLCIFLSARLADKIQQQLSAAYPPETPVAILYRVSWPDEKIILTQLSRLSAAMREQRLVRTTLILVGTAIGGRRNRSRLYDATHAHIFRKRRAPRG